MCREALLLTTAVELTRVDTDLGPFNHNNSQDACVALFVKLIPEASELDMEKLDKHICGVIKTRLSTRHVPAYIRHVLGCRLFSSLWGLESLRLKL